MKARALSLILTAIMLVCGATQAAAHCEIPCGIYDDQLRADLIAEHLTTIEKSMKHIMELGKKDTVNYNQLVRWVSNKEKHASEVQHIVTQYFMTQRIKPTATKYTEKVVVLHKMLIHAMKCKQTTDLSQVNALKSLLKEFEVLYFGHSHK